jgi:hypothetical protein
MHEHFEKTKKEKKNHTFFMFTNLAERIGGNGS